VRLLAPHLTGVAASQAEFAAAASENLADGSSELKMRDLPHSFRAQRGSRFNGAWLSAHKNFHGATRDARTVLGREEVC